MNFVASFAYIGKKVADEIRLMHGVSLLSGQELRALLPILFKDKAIKMTVDNFANYRSPDSSA